MSVATPEIKEKNLEQPGLEKELNPPAQHLNPAYRPAGKLEGKVALITGGDSGIGRSVAIYFALEGANLTIVCHPKEIDDANWVKNLIESKTPEEIYQEQIKLAKSNKEKEEKDKQKQKEQKEQKEEGGKEQKEKKDSGKVKFEIPDHFYIPYHRKDKPKCQIVMRDFVNLESVPSIVDEVISYHGRLDILVNNAAVQHYRSSFMEMDIKVAEDTFKINILSMFALTKAALPHLKPGSTIINTTSITSYRGSANLPEYSSTKGAITTFTRSLSTSLLPKHIRVNAVAPGPIYTPLIPSTFPAEGIESFGGQCMFERYGQPCEVAPSYVFLASDDSTYFSGQVLHPNGGVVING